MQAVQHDKPMRMLTTLAVPCRENMPDTGMMLAFLIRKFARLFTADHLPSL